MEEAFMEEQAKIGMPGNGDKQLENNQYSGKSAWYR